MALAGAFSCAAGRLHLSEGRRARPLVTMAFERHSNPGLAGQSAGGEDQPLRGIGTVIPRALRGVKQPFETDAGQAPFVFRQSVPELIAEQIGGLVVTALDHMRKDVKELV